MEQASAGLLPAPPMASWIVTRACNLKCYYCFADAWKRDPDELSTAEAVAVIDDLAAAGTSFLIFLGGEPLLRKDIYQLIDHSTDAGMYASILTNGRLVTSSVVDRLNDAGCQLLGVSIDHLDPAIHDRVRGVRGSLAGARAAIRHAIRAGMRCSVRIVVTPESHAAIPDLFRWALDEGVEELIVIPIFMVGRAAGTVDDRRADLRGKELFFSALDQLRRIAEPLGISVPREELACCVGIELSAPGTRNRHEAHAIGFEKCLGCKVGRWAVSIQPNGDVHSCPFVHHVIGSLRRQSILEIWQAPLLRLARERDLGCLARSIIHLGRPDQPDPTAGRPPADLLGELGGEPAPARTPLFVPLNQVGVRHGRHQ